ncbi:hypothetical protein BDN72DRAFT_842914 [Pluteus cervinus]|uniref:Uncharacterized protein n=1 Tax=Pluteus cervinus TaxID=181527 RepID=A0ACD3APC2_9AGAR|nr:hypothetical protein BDN72DRAFT_842914 [Pluteus cervinus]
MYATESITKTHNYFSPTIDIDECKPKSQKIIVRVLFAITTFKFKPTPIQPQPAYPTHSSPSPETDPEA